ncbi:hypothetical protein PGSY75_1234600 [Plasmodium gaboni]|uniref:POTRA domain-containing protein n=1 Tax=Plasmodium gaboni TaxID=647221 RepID=A0A151LGN4_9APIC|nr:hypothetical protein PGSY75_1234600 [Plasmodium gaboni]KYN98145.1 hypothetical protein PGSY75_1234600 [Plasmodium gaboni]
MKNVLRKYIYLFILINFVLSTYSKVIKRGDNNITSNYLFPNNYDNDSIIYKKRNSNKFYFLENERNKLKELWNKLTTRYSIKFHTDDESSNEENGKNNKISFKNVFNKISIQDNMEIINNIIIKNSTIINPEILNELMKQNKLLTIRYKDINTIINIINNYYAGKNYLFSKVLMHEVIHQGKQKTLIIYVKECIVHKILVKIHSCDKETKEADSNWNKIRKGFQESGNVERNIQMDHKDVKLFDKKDKLYDHNGKSSNNNDKPSNNNDKPSNNNDKPYNNNDKLADPNEVSPNPNVTNFNKDDNPNNNENENISIEEQKEDILLNRESVLYKDVLNYNLKEKSGSNRKLRRFFENKMNIKENSIFTWNENIYNLLVNSNLFKYVQMKLYNDKSCNKNILEINVIENKRMIFIPSLSKGFNDFLEFCLNLSFSYLHNLKYSDKFRMKYFQNLNYKNNKHNYDFIFINDLIELEKLKKNYPSFQIMGMNINKEYKKEVHTSSLNNLMTIISIKNDNNDDETLNISSRDINESNSVLSSTPKYTLQIKDIYNYLYKKTFFFFFIKRMNNVILEVKMKFKRKDFQNFFYFLKEQKYYSNDKGSTQVYSNKSDDHNNDNNKNNDNTYNNSSSSSSSSNNNTCDNLSNISKWKNRLLYTCMNLFRDDKKSVLSNKLYNLYGSKIKLSTSINLCNPNLFETSNFLKKYFNIKNKFDLIFYFNMEKNNFPYINENSTNTIKNNDNNKEDNLNSKNKNDKLHKDLQYFFKHVNNKSSHLKWNNINNIYLNYTLYFNKNYEINIYHLFCSFQHMIKRKIIKIKNYYTKERKKQKKEKKTNVINELNLSNNDNVNSVYIPLYFFKLSINHMSLLLNIMFSFKKNLWNFNNILFNFKDDNDYKNGNNILTYLKNILKCNIKNEQDNSKKFKENIQKINVTASNGNFSNNTSCTYTVNNINMNDAYKEYFNKMNLSLNYKLIFPVIFNNYFLNLLHMKLYLFFNYNIFDKLQNYNINNNENNNTEQNHKHVNNMNMNNILKGYYLKGKKKKKKKEHHDNSSYGLGILLANMNIYLNFKLYGNNFLPSLVLKSKEDNSKFNYLL